MKIESKSEGGRMDLFWGQSYKSYDVAVAAAVKAARRELKGKDLEWFEVVEFRGGFVGKRLQYQIAIRVGYA